MTDATNHHAVLDLLTEAARARSTARALTDAVVPRSLHRLTCGG
ncbi:hypothetical protein [Streptomyces sp. SID8374]|nr:hypothetical protein [Streptomyces sp. SID8374]